MTDDLQVTQEYIWIDGTKPVAQIRSKTKVTPYTPNGNNPAKWTFDGSSTNQATGRKSDLILNPVRQVADPFRGALSTLVLCEVLNEDGTPHESNTRAVLRAAMEKAAALEPWVGFEQEYVLYSRGNPMGWPQGSEPAPQGPYYCAVGGGLTAGRDIVESHLKACIDAGVQITGINAEVMLGQWEFQVGPVGRAGDPLLISDHLWLARWILNRIAEESGIRVSLDCKPVKGDWNGSGLHTNFSTAPMRDAVSPSPVAGMSAIKSAIERLAVVHNEHIAVYGHGLEDRLTGQHETCDINTFKWGIGDRTASIRIPLHVAEAGGGYLEDRRPGANGDPYKIAARLLETICV
jgi:glutamine synthetase